MNEKEREKKKEKKKKSRNLNLKKKNLIHDKFGIGEKYARNNTMLSKVTWRLS